MNIVLEGPDGGGKSSLAERLSNLLNMRVQQGSGPPKRSGEIEERAKQYLLMTDTIFDRHPLVSQHMYGAIRQETLSTELRQLTKLLYSPTTLIVYCRVADDDTFIRNHVVKEGENPDHLRTLAQNYGQLISLYDRWAVGHAHIIYRIGQPTADIVSVALGRNWK